MDKPGNGDGKLSSVLVVIPCRGHFDYARRAVISLVNEAARHREPRVEYVIVDDASREWHSLSWRDWPDPDCRKIRFEAQAGLTRSWNAGLRLAREISAKYAVCTNSDVLFSRAWFEPLAEALESGFDLVGPVTNAPGEATWQSVRPFCTQPRPRLDDNADHMDLVVKDIRARKVGTIEAPINGFFLMAKTRTWWRGAFSRECVFNPDYPLEHNETELERRWLQAGRRIGFCPRSYIFHYRSVSRPAGLKGRLGKGAFRGR
jgi:GT2 family glycosyltransferase